MIPDFDDFGKLVWCCSLAALNFGKMRNPCWHVESHLKIQDFLSMSRFNIWFMNLKDLCCILHMACLPGLTMFPMFIPCLSNQFLKQQKLKELIRTGFWLRWKLSQVTRWPGMVTAVYFWFILWRVDPLPMVIWTQLTNLIGPRPWKYVWRNVLFSNTVFFLC